MASHSAETRRREIDWYSFLDRPRLPSPAAGSLDPLRRASVLVTGAGGSIGSALSIRLAIMGTRELILLDSSEQALHRLRSALDSSSLATQPHLLLGNVGNLALLGEIFDAYRPEVVFHAAAYKHVPLLEEHPLEAIENNALNTLALAETVKSFHCLRFVFLSTDKAVEPISILGATKRIGERITVANQGVALRLGNVLGTEGSVSETFARQIANGEAITITGREQRRYFLTCEEAVDLLLLSAVEASDGATLAPAIDRQHSIASLAEFLIATLAPGQVIPVRETGPRSGDKPQEKLWAAMEKPDRIEDPGYFQLHSEEVGVESASFTALLQSLRAAVTSRDRIAALECVRRLVPDYVPSETLLSAISTQTPGAMQS